MQKTGAHLWDQSYDREFEGIDALAVQDDLTDRIVASVADPYGGLMRDLSAAIVDKAPQTLTPYEAVVRHSIYRQRLDAEDHLETRMALENAVEIAPGNADIWSALAAVYIEELKHDYNRPAKC